MYLLIALLCVAVAYEAAEALTRVANLTSVAEPRSYFSGPSSTSK